MARIDATFVIADSVLLAEKFPNTYPSINIIQVMNRMRENMIPKSMTIIQKVNNISQHNHVACECLKQDKTQ